MGIRKKDTIVSLAGVLLGQLILFACFTLIGRYWGAEELGNLNMNLSLGMFLGTVIALRYELACVQDNQSESYRALIHTTLLSVTLLITLYILATNFSKNAHEMVLIFAATFIIQQASSLYFNTQRKYALIAALKILSSLGFAASIATFIYLERKSDTFEAYTITNLAISLIVLLVITKESGKVKVEGKFYKEYINFPKYTLPATCLNSALTYSLPIIIPLLFGPLIAGFFAATQRFGFFPVSLTAQSISGIFRRELISSINSKPESILKTYISHAKLLTSISVLYLALGNVLFGPLIEILLGTQWSESGKYFHILSPLYAFQIIYTPLSQVFIASNNQRRDLFIQALIFVAAVGSLLTSYILSIEITSTLIIFSASCTTALLIGTWMTYQTVLAVSKERLIAAI